MKYMGGKTKHSKEILNVIISDLGELYSNNLNWVEPFVGGANMIDKVGSYFKNRIGADSHFHLIEMFKSLQENWIPPANLSEIEYQQLKIESKTDSKNPLIAFAGFPCSYAGKWFGGYARGNNKDGTPRNYAREGKDNLLKQKNNLIGIKFFHSDYKELEIPANSIIYCDPPYFGATNYKNKFNHKEFWEWCEKRAGEGHKVYVSEYSAPENWLTIWEKPVKSSLTKDTGSKSAVEKLFKLKYFY